MAAVEALKAVRAKVDDYFGRCRLAAFDARALAALNRKEEEYLAVDLAYGETGERTITLSAHGDHYADILRSLGAAQNDGYAAGN